ncbi:beta-lactamase/transpeptidase-like protein, partial [Xylariales sp. PMI_506]
MRVINGCLATLVSVGSLVIAPTNTIACPVLGPAVPAPTELSSNEKFKAAVEALDDAVTDALETGESSSGPGLFNATTMSIGMFSLDEDQLVYQRHYTDPSVSSSEDGVNDVDANSIYRLGSISKLLTVYLFLIREGDSRFNDPITKYIPELATAGSNTGASNGVTPPWGDITIGQLASHMGGLPRDYGVNEISYPWLQLPGLPPLSEDQVPPCNYLTPDGQIHACDTQDFFDGILAESAIFLPGSTPGYSNVGLQLLALALENITGCSMESMFTESIVQWLDLNGTSYTTPESTERGVIPDNKTISSWDSDAGLLSPSGGYFSTTNDMASVGRAILNSTLLPSALTRRWMKPVSFTSDVNVAVGAPWEIFRTQVGNRTVDMYCKNGGLGAYSTLFVLIPDFNFGFVILTASGLGESLTTNYVWFLSEMIGSAVLPVLDEVARDQGNTTFAGHYSTNSLNSSLDIVVDEHPGLRVTNWISNGTDFLDALLQVSGGSSVDGSYVDFRLQPNQLYSGTEIGFTGTWQVLPATIVSGPFSINCPAWGSVDTATYGNVGIEEFVFEIDSKSKKAINIQPKAFRISLARQS